MRISVPITMTDEMVAAWIKANEDVPYICRLKIDKNRIRDR